MLVLGLSLFLIILCDVVSAQQCVGHQHNVLDVGYLYDQYKKHDPKANASKVIGIYIETDWYTRNAFGNELETLQWIKDRYLELARVYAEEGISTALTGYFIPTATEDWSWPYINDPFALMNEFGRRRQDLPDGRLKHFVSLGGFQQGISWINVLEADYFSFISNGQTLHAGPFSVSLGVTGVNWPTNVLSHEMGHAIGSRHTFDCVWGNGSQAIDRCQGNTCSLSPLAELFTIMSYCQADWRNGFGVEIGDLLRSIVGGASRDLLDGHTPILLYLAGDISGAYSYTEGVFLHEGVSSNNLSIAKQ